MRDRFFPIYAFYNELEKIRNVVSESMAGFIRFQWWRDAIDELYEGSIAKHRHEITKDLREIILDVEIDKQLFHDLIDAHESDLEFEQPYHMDDVRKYCEKTSGKLFELLLAAAEINDEKSREAAGYAGAAYGIANILRKMRYDSCHGRLMLPEEVLAANNISAGEVSAGEHLDKAAIAVRALCDKAEVNLKHVRVLLDDMPKNSRYIFLPLCVACEVLKRIKKLDYDVFHNDPEAGKFGLQIAILKSRMLGGF